jgi:hypothetical protein
LLQRTPTEGSYQQSLLGKFLVWSLLILGTVEVFMGDFSKTINLKKKKKKTALRLSVSLSWFKETGGLHSVRRSRVPTSVAKFL